PCRTATPAESYPRYSSRLNPSTSTDAASLGPTYPTIPHIAHASFVLSSSSGFPVIARPNRASWASPVRRTDPGGAHRRRGCPRRQMRRRLRVLNCTLVRSTSHLLPSSLRP